MLQRLPEPPSSVRLNPLPCTCVLHFLYPHNCWRTLGFLPPSGCWESGCCEHGWAKPYLFKSLLSVLWGPYPEVGLLNHTVTLHLSVWGTALRFPRQLHHFTFLQATHRTSKVSISSVASPLIFCCFRFVCFSYNSHLHGVKCLPSIALISISHFIFCSLLLFSSSPHSIAGVLVAETVLDNFSMRKFGVSILIVWSSVAWAHLGAC